MNLRRTLSLMAVAVIAAAAGVAGPLAAGSSSASPSLVLGGSPAANELLLAQLARLPVGDITGAEFGSPSALEIENGVPDRGDNWLYLRGAASDRGDAVTTAWEGGLLASSYADLARAAGLGELTGITIDVYGSNGELLEQNGWFIPPSDQSLVPPIAVDRASARAEVTARFGSGARAIGAVPGETSFLEIPHLAPTVSITVNDGRAFVADAKQLLSTVIGQDRNYDGRLIRVVDAGGSTVLVSAMNFRTRSGELWIAPEYEASFDGGFRSG